MLMAPFTMMTLVRCSLTASFSSLSRLEKIESITNPKSSTVKLFKALQTKRKRRVDEGATIIEGHRLVMDLLMNDEERHKENRETLVKNIILSNKALSHKEYGSKLKHLLETCHLRSDPPRISLGTDDVISQCCDTVTPQGIVAICSTLPPFESIDVLAQNRSKPSLYLLLDGVSDPGNVGTLLRSAVAVGVKGVILLPGSCDVWAPKSIRSGMGATFKVPTRSVSSFEEALHLLDECGVERQAIYAATMESEKKESQDIPSTSSLPHYQVDWCVPSALCLGQEGNGLSDIIRDRVKNGEISSVHVPMQPGIESLNAAVCGSIIMFEHFRQSATSQSR